MGLEAGVGVVGRGRLVIFRNLTDIRLVLYAAPP